MTVKALQGWYYVPEEFVKTLPQFDSYNEFKVVSFIATFAGIEATRFTHRELIEGTGIKSINTVKKALNLAKEHEWIDWAVDKTRQNDVQYKYFICSHRAEYLPRLRGNRDKLTLDYQHLTVGDQFLTHDCQPVDTRENPHDAPKNDEINGVADDSDRESPVTTTTDKDSYGRSNLGRDRGVGEEKPLTPPSKGFKKRDINAKGVKGNIDTVTAAAAAENVQATAPADERRRDPATELETVLVSAMSQNWDTKPKDGRLTLAGVRKLNQQVITDFGVEPSPEDLWRNDPEYQMWVRQTIAYFLTVNDHDKPIKAQAHLLALICKYHNGGKGYHEFKKKLAAQRLEEAERERKQAELAAIVDQPVDPEEEARRAAELQALIDEDERILAEMEAKEQASATARQQKEMEEWLRNQ